MVLRDDVENRRARDLRGVIETHAMQNTCPSVMTGGVKFIESERRHHLDLVLRHGAERITRMVAAAGRLLGIAVAAQISANHGEFARQRGRDLEPRQMRERIAMHQQQRRSTAADDGYDARAVGFDVATLEAFHLHGNSKMPPWRARQPNRLLSIKIAKSSPPLPILGKNSGKTTVWPALACRNTPERTKLPPDFFAFP